MIAPCLASRCTPKAIIMVIDAGMLSGMAATASATAVKNAPNSLGDLGNVISTIKMMIAMIMTDMLIIFPIFDKLF